MNPRLKDFLLALVFGGLLGGTLGWLLDELTWSRLSESRLLAAIVYGPLAEIADPQWRIAIKAACDAIAFAAVWQSMRFRRWLPLATVLVMGTFYGVVIAMADVGAFRSLSRFHSLVISVPTYDLRGFVHNSPEGTLFLLVATFAWYGLLIGCLARGWMNKAPVLLPAPPVDATGEFSATVAPHASRWLQIGKSLLDAAAPFAAGIFIGIGLGSVLDSLTEWVGLYLTPPQRVDQIVRLVAVGPISLLRYEGRTTVPVLAPLLATAALLLWKVADGLHWRRLASAVYLSLLTVQLGSIVWYAASVGVDSFIDIELEGLETVIVRNKHAAAWLSLILAACHAYAIWCLFRYRQIPADREA